MRRWIACTGVVVSVLGVMLSPASRAGATTTLWFHTGTAANVDQALRTAGLDRGPFMDANPPTRSAPSIAVVHVGNGAVWNGPYQPAWSGRVSGVLTSASVTFWASSAASTKLLVRLYADGSNTPFATQTVVPTPSISQLSASFPSLNQRVNDVLLVQVNTSNATTGTRADAEVFFDSTANPSSFTYAATPLPTSGVTPPNFANYPAPGTFQYAHGPNETSIGVNAKTGNVLFQMTGDTARVRWDDTTSPPTAIWDDVSLHANSIGFDTIMHTDRETGRTMVTQLLLPVSSMAFTDDDGDHWTFGQPPSSAPSFDHETVGSGPWALPVPPTATYPHAFYYCAQAGVTAQCARSDNGGLTWGAPVPFNIGGGANRVLGADCDAAIHGHVVVGSDGAVYLPDRSCFGTQGLYASFDNGLTWTLNVVNGMAPSKDDPGVALDRGGRLYFASTSPASSGVTKAVVSTSTDRGAHFSAPVDVGASLGIKNAVFPSVVAGDGGRAAMSFYGTTTAGDFQDPAFTGAWHVYVATTLDGGATWTTVDVTPNDPVQRGLICLAGVSCSQGRNLLDFQSMTVDTQGRIIVGYADGCTTPTCIAADGQTNAASGSTDSLGTIARQTTGPRLFAAFG